MNEMYGERFIYIKSLTDGGVSKCSSCFHQEQSPAKPGGCCECGVGVSLKCPSLEPRPLSVR